MVQTNAILYLLFYSLNACNRCNWTKPKLGALESNSGLPYGLSDLKYPNHPLPPFGTHQWETRMERETQIPISILPQEAGVISEVCPALPNA